MAAAIGHRRVRAARRIGSPGISAVLDVLDVLDRDGPATLAQLARETGIAKSTLHRVCSMMSERGWVTRDPHSGHLDLGPRVAWLAHSAPASPLTAGFQDVAHRLVARHNETTCLTVLDGRESVFIAKEETTHQVRLVTAVGNRLPAFAAASGRVMLADLPEERVAALYDGYASSRRQPAAGWPDSTSCSGSSARRAGADMPRTSTRPRSDSIAWPRPSVRRDASRPRSPYAYRRGE